MTIINDDNLLYSSDELAFRQQIKEFVDSEMKPIVESIVDQTFEYRSFFKKMGEAGLTGLLIPEKYGGTNKPFMYQLIAGEEISAVSPTATMMFGASCTLSAIPILRFGTEEQKQKYLIPIAKGDKIGALAITEPNVGSDTAGMETKAVWNEEEQCWILNGEKRYITNASIADQIVTFAITDPNVDSKSGMSAFIIEPSWKGFSVVKDFKLMGREGVYNTHFKMENVKVPKENILGKLNQGFLVLMDELDSERIGIAAEALGCMRTPFELAVEHSQNRIQFGRPISRFEAISFKIADMATKMRASRLLMVSAARMMDKKLPCTKEATMAKLFATEASIEVIDMALQILGGKGYVRDFNNVERFYRDARLGTIGGGTSEIMRFLIQREIYIESKRGKTSSPLALDIDFSSMMEAIPNGFRPDRAEGVSAKIQFIFSDDKPWLLDIENKTANVSQTELENPAMTIKTDKNTWKNILLGKQDAMQAMMTGKVNIDTEDMDLLLKFARMFKFSPDMLQGIAPSEEATKTKKKFEVGKSINEIEVGEEVTDSMKITEGTISHYGEFSGDYNPLHFDDEYAATTIFGKKIAHGPIAGGLVARLIGMKLPGLGTLAYNMKINFRAPVYPGDTLTATIKVTDKLVDKNIVKLSFTVQNQDEIEVLNGYANVMPPVKE